MRILAAGRTLESQPRGQPRRPICRTAAAGCRRNRQGRRRSRPACRAGRRGCPRTTPRCRRVRRAAGPPRPPPARRSARPAARKRTVPSSPVCAEAQWIAEQGACASGMLRVSAVKRSRRAPPRAAARPQQRDAVVGEAVFALHARVDRRAQRHHQLEFQFAPPLGHHAVGEAVDAARHRARRHEAQELGGRTRARPVMVMISLGSWSRSGTSATRLRSTPKMRPRGEDADPGPRSAPRRRCPRCPASRGVVERGVGNLNAHQEALAGHGRGSRRARPAIQPRLGHLRGPRSRGAASRACRR